MKKIIIKEIRFVNFKGFRNAAFEFGERVTSIGGRNGSGKTSIFDGFTWLLFGKDSQDRKSFNIKTLDASGNAIPKQPHEVSAVLDVDGEKIELCRRFNEKWVKRRGQVEEEFTGHEEERIYNGVPLSLKEWNEKICAICSEQVFKFITNPKYFSAQKPDVQRAMLFRMAGDVTDEEIAAGNGDFSALLSALTGKTMEEYRKEIQAKKRRIKAEIEAIPERIDERKRDIAALSEHDFPAIEKKIEEKQQRVSEIEEELLDISKRGEGIAKKKAETIRQLSELKSKKISIEYNIKEQATAEYRKAASKRNELQSQIADLERRIDFHNERIGILRGTVEECASIREKLIAEWKKINASAISFNDSDFVCQTCKRPLYIDDIEKKQQEMTENFNEHKASLLAENINRGQANKKRMDDAKAAISHSESEIEQAQQSIAAIKASPDFNAEIEEPDARAAIEANEEYRRLSDMIEQKEKELASIDNTSMLPDCNNQKKELAALKSEIDALKRTLADRDTIVRNTQRIGELEAQYRSGAIECADLESIEFTISEFSKAKVAAIEERINGMFSFVKFKMFEHQINGADIETCEATADGVPYSGQNNAMQINMGLDIINAICKYEGITAPIFIDNAESVNELIPTNSQLIRLVVTENETLTIQ